MKYIVPFLFMTTICNALVDITVDQAFVNFGFHRLLKSNITVYGNLSSCHLVVEEKFPRNFIVYANELEELSKYEVKGKLNNEIDPETSVANALPFSVYIYLNDSLPVTTSNEYHSTFLYYLRAHVRYHDPKIGGGYREFKKQPAVLFARCPEGSSVPNSVVVKFPCDSSSADLCNWNTLTVTHKNLNPQLSVPVGNTDLHQLIFLSTHITAYIGVFIILYNLFSTKIKY